MSTVYIIEDDRAMADCLKLWVQRVAPAVEIYSFPDAVAAVNTLDQTLPDLILLDVLLSGVDGFTFLNELMSYQDTAKIPVVIITSLDLSHQNLEHYGVQKVLDKSTMTPADVCAAIRDGLAITESEPSYA